MTVVYTNREIGERAWGRWCVLEIGEKYVVKKITVDVGRKISLQTHAHRNEHWVIVAGTAQVTLGRSKIIKNPNETVFIPVSEFHRIENVGNEPLEFIEVQTGDYLGEDDIARFDENYQPLKA